METVVSFWQLVLEALLLEGSAFIDIQNLGRGSRIVLLIVFLAGFSEALGQSVVLFVSRVKPRRFVASLLLSAGLYAFSYGFWAFSIWLLDRLLFDSAQPFAVVARTVGLGYAPRLFGFLGFMPYFGGPVLLVLSLWSLLAIVIGVSISLKVSLWQAVLYSALGWLVLQISLRTVGYPLLKLTQLLRQRVAGVPMVSNKQELEQLLELSLSEVSNNEETSE